MKRPRAWFLAAVLGAALGCSNSDVSSGDRVLVDKLQYESGLKNPQRYDVVVFKYPKGPIEANTPKNYIKRLLGLPGELIAIFFGRLFHFVVPPGAPLPFQDHTNPEINAKDLWQRSPFMHVDDPASQKLFQDGSFKILRKPPSVMLALRRIVFDNDFQPKDMVQFPRWAPGPDSAWKAELQNKSFSFAGGKAEQVDWLRYQHRLRPKNGGPIAGNTDIKTELITDVTGYNSIEIEGQWQPVSFNWAGDLMLECNVDAKKGDGEFWLELSKGIHRFQARWDLNSGVCTLFKSEFREADQAGKKVMKLIQRVEMDSKPTKLRGPGAYQVRFANIDARLTVWVDRELPFGDGKDYPPPEVRNGAEERNLDEIDLQKRRGPTLNDLEPASIGSSGADIKVSHIKLWRDTYYTLSPQGADFSGHDFDFADVEKFANYRSKMDFKTMYIQPGHYLCLGDNSQASSDSREWGVVPQRLMLGRALLVYYPFHRAGAIR